MHGVRGSLKYSLEKLDTNGMGSDEESGRSGYAEASKLTWSGESYCKLDSYLLIWDW